MAAASAIATDQTPPTAESEVAPQRCSARNAVSRRGRTTKRHQQVHGDHDDQRKCRQPMIGGDVARLAVNDGSRPDRRRARWSRARGQRILGRGIDRRRRLRRRSLRRVAVPPPRPRASHHRPKPSMMAAAIMPRPGAANGVVPKNGIGNGVLDRGRAGQRRHGEGRGAERDRRRHQAARHGRPSRNSASAIGASTKKATNRLTPP